MNCKEEIKNKLDIIYKEFKSKIEPLRTEIDKLEAEEFVGNFYTIEQFEEMYVFVKSIQYNADKRETQFKCIVVTEFEIKFDWLYLDCMDYEPITKEYFEREYKKTLNRLNYN